MRVAEINLKPFDEHDDPGKKVVAVCKRRWIKCRASNLFLQPTQDLTIDTRSAAPSTSLPCRPRHWMRCVPGCRG
ncbi:hypothetical protein ACLK19_13920 [Escherichia coli]